tara:strand:- start:101057 stop:102670 length:1614 start_codon:yes stop_codon:yes gene_type:complete
MKLGLCQINATVGSFEGNKRLILEYYERCIYQKLDLAIFPELVITGYPPQDLLWEDGFISENLRVLNEISLVSTIPIILGFVRKEKGKIFNSAALCYDGKIQGYADKILLPTYDVFDEDRYFTPGKEPSVWEVPVNDTFIKAGIQICEDLWDFNYEKNVSGIQKEYGAEMIINISASPFSLGRIHDRVKLIKKKVQETGLPFVYCNLVGGQDELIFDGESLCFDNKGNLINQGEAFNEQLLITDINKNSSMNFFVCDDNEKIYGALCLGVKDYFNKTGTKEAVIGLSGGIDSTLTACIATDALGSKNVHGISMPSKYSSNHSINDAKKLAKNLNIDFRVIPINSLVESYEIQLHEHFLGTEKNVAEENIQARIRGNLLMAMSNKFGWMVLTTGNKTELALGYCTLYGDMSGGLSVLSDLSKSQVYSLSKFANKKSPRRIPLNCIEKLPSAELDEGQFDPFDYKLISPLVDSIIEDKKSPFSLINEGFDSNLVNDLYQRIRFHEYKRRQSAIGLRVSIKAFGTGRRVPIVNHFKGKLK